MNDNRTNPLRRHAAIKRVNPLDKFSSYTVHYVLLAARSTEALEGIIGQKSTTPATLAAINNIQNLGGSLLLPGIEKDEVILVVDTRRFTQFTIDNLKYDVWVNGLQKGASTANLATDLSMTIIDSVGISFANFMQSLLDVRLKCSYDGITWLLQVLFVGTSPEGQTETVQTVMIPMILQQMDIDLNYAKGTYEMLFMPNMNFDTRKHSKFLRIPSGGGSAISTTGNLGELISSFQNNLNESSNRFYQSLRSTVLTQDELTSPTPRKIGRRVQYNINIPPKWNDWNVTSSSQVNSGETLFGADGKPIPAPTVDKSKNGVTHAADESVTSITAYLNTIFSRVKEIAEMANFKKIEESPGVSQVTFYKIIVGLSSSRSSDFIVHVNVVEFSVPQIQQQVGRATNESNVDNDIYDRVRVGETEYILPRNYYAFDYIFTGRNDQVLNFDLKIQDFQFLLASNLKVGPAAVNQVSDTGTGEIEGRELFVELTNLREYDPVLAPVKSEHQKTAFSMLSNSTPKKESIEVERQMEQYTKNLSMFYAGSPIVANLTIKGDPMIMQGFNIGHVLPVTTPKTQGEKTRSYEDLINRILRISGGEYENGTVVVKKIKSSPSYAISPVFVHVNVKGPNVDFETNNPISGDYATSVLSDNYYVVFKVSNKIEGSVFTQELELYSHNVFGSYKMDKTGRIKAS